ncbi:hypothetical protein [Hymenobacter antarcticus]|uniref:Por secretion system C-terminal sorting domain-containing protein n=1 Tax=Hymenobacter antarcticus TaxID=486270 RepID=A0ABP7R1J5_9BACT
MIMRQLLLSLFLLLGFTTYAQPATWNYVFPLSDLNGVMDVATDSDGNAYVTGRFTGSLQLGGTQLSSAQAGPCLYLAKMSPGGQVLRVTKLEGATDVLPRSIAVDGAGNTYVTGSFSGTLTYNNGQQTTSLLATPAGGTIFLLKCNPGGSVSWVRQADGSATGAYRFCQGTAVAVDNAGNSYIGGTVSGDNIRFGTLALGAHSRDGFLASYDQLGRLRWARVLTHLSTSFGSSQAGGVAVDGAGNCYLSGHSYSGFSLDGISLPLPVDTDYLARFDTSQGQLRWARSTPGDGGGQALALDRAGDIYSGGTFSGTVSLGRIALTSAGDADGYVARYDKNGGVDWAVALGGHDYDVVSSLAVDQSSGKVFAAGMLNYTAQGTNQSFMANINPNGRIQRTELVGGTGTSSCGQLAIDDQNNVYSTGVFTGSCGFGPIALSTTSTKGYFGRFGRRPGQKATNQENSMAAEISIFPIPARQQFTVRLAGTDEVQQAVLYNTQGHIVARRTIEPTAERAETAFETTALPDGLYVLRLVSARATTTRLLTVQH